MNLPYTLVEKSVLRKPNSEKSIGTVLTDTIAWMNSLEEGNSVANFFYYAEVIDSDTKDRYFVYSDEAVAYFGLADNIVEADNAGNTSNGNIISVSEAPGYSEDEVLTERRWTDGKPIYRKVVKLGDIRNSITTGSATNVIDLGNSECETTVQANVFLDNYDETYSYYNSSSSQRRFICNAKELVILISDSELPTLTNVSVITEYTKTTDTASSPVAQIDIIGNNTISVSEAPGYSTEEVLTERRWVDGKPIYRKVVIINRTNTSWSNQPYADDVEFVVSNIVEWQQGTNEWLNGGQISGSTSYTDSSVSPNGINYVFRNTTYDKMKVIIEYTKTTDTTSSPVAQISIPEIKDVYSEEETETNKVRFGKKVYRKCFTGTLGSDDMIVTTGLTGADKCKVTEFAIYRTNNISESGTSSYFVRDTSGNLVECSVDGSEIFLSFSDGVDGYNGAEYEVTLEYIKTV